MHSAHYLFGSKPKKSTILTLNLVTKRVFAMYGICLEDGKVYIPNEAKQNIPRTRKTLHSLKE
jgi:hypothetical protein